MITHLRLKSFKSWADTGTLRLAPITGLFGPNSSGKSSILQALLLLKQTAESRDRNLVLHFGDDTTLVNLGDYASIAHRHDLDSTVSFTLGWELDHGGRGKRRTDEYKDIEFAVTFAASPGRGASSVVVDEMTYTLQAEHERTSLGLSRDAGTDTYSFFANPSAPQPKVDADRAGGTAPINFYGFPFEISLPRKYGSLAYDSEHRLNTLLSHTRYLGPLRARPRRQYSWSGDRPLDTGQAGERTIHALLSAMNTESRTSLFQLLESSSLSEQTIARWLKRLNLIDSFRVEQLVEGRPYYEVKVRKSPHSAEVLLADVGFGVSQILPVLALSLMVPPGSTILLEQPELHLHPAVQADLADILIEAATQRRVQFIVESHSENLLRRLQRRVAEAAAISERDVALYFCANEGTESTIVPLNLDTYGNIRSWPTSFFGDEFSEIAATSKAGLRRRLRDEPA